MIKLGIATVLLALIVGAASDHLPSGCDVRPFVALAFAFFLTGMFILIRYGRRSTDK